MGSLISFLVGLTPMFALSHLGLINVRLENIITVLLNTPTEVISLSAGK
jgi:hypothetical protein